MADYDLLFESLADACWLLASRESCEARKERYSLLIDPSKINYYFRKALNNIYEAAVIEKNECDYITDAIDARTIGKGLIGTIKSISDQMKGRYEINYEGTIKYLSREDYPSQLDLENEKDRFEMLSTNKITIFYLLTITAVRAEEIRRQLS